MCGSAPAAPTLPQYPSLTGAETTNINQQAGAAQQGSQMLGTVSNQLGQNTNILQQISGLFNSDGSLNQTALANLQSQSGASTQAAGQAGQSALAGMSGTQGSLNATSAAYQQALQGNVPQNQALQFQQNQSFQQMQEQAAQQGIPISGTNFSNAVSNSTAGQKLIQNFQQTANQQTQQYAQGYTQTLAGNMGQLSSAQSTQAGTGTTLGNYATQTPLNYLQSSITNGQSALSPLLSAYQTQLSSAYQPLYMQQTGPYQQQMAQAQANYQAGENEFNNQQNQIGMLTPSASFMGFGANPHAGGTAADLSSGSGSNNAMAGSGA